MLPDARKMQVLFLHSNLVECVPGAKGVTGLHSLKVSIVPHQQPCPMLNLCEVVLATNSKELLNSSQKHAIITKLLGMVLPLAKGKRGSFGQGASSRETQGHRTL